MNTKDFVVGQIKEIPEITGNKCYLWKSMLYSDAIGTATLDGTFIPDLFLAGISKDDFGYEDNEIGYQFIHDGKCYEVSIFCIDGTWHEIDTKLVALRETMDSWYDVFVALSL